MKLRRELAPILAEIKKCNRCGLCSQNCPSYREYRQEIASPRGRMQVCGLLIEGKINIKKDKKDILFSLNSCQNCFNCTATCPAGLCPQEIVNKTREVFVPKTRKYHFTILRDLIFKFLFRKFLKKSKTVFLTSDFNFKELSKTLNLLQNNFGDIMLYPRPLILAQNYFDGSITKIFGKLSHLKFDKLVVDDIENYRIIKNATLKGYLPFLAENILFLSDSFKKGSIKGSGKYLIFLSNTFLGKDILTETSSIKYLFKQKDISFANSRYYFGPLEHTKTIEYLKTFPSDTIFIPLSKREYTFLVKIVRKNNLPQKVCSLREMLNNMLL